MFGWTVDQQLAFWNAIGTWVSGLGTLCAVIVALHLALRSERISLRISAYPAEIHPPSVPLVKDWGSINVTNLGDRPVTVNIVGWAVGKGKARRYVVQTTWGPHTSPYPVELSHGKSAQFMWPLQDPLGKEAGEMWARDFLKLLEPDFEKSLRTLVVQVHTSVGKTIEVRPDDGFLKRLREARASGASGTSVS